MAGRRPRRRIGAWLATFVVVSLLPSFAANAAPAPCRVVNHTAGGEHYAGDGAALAMAIQDADAGSTLAIRGLCVGTFQIGKALTLVGKESQLIPLPTLGGGDEGTVLTVQAPVTIRDLRVRNGDAQEGGGVYNADRLVLRGSTLVFGNRARYGGGIYNQGTLVIRGETQIRGNRARFGGGIYFLGGTLFLTGSSTVRANRAVVDGGGVFHELDIVVMTRHASVKGNVAGDYGGGIFGSGFMGDIIILRRAAAVVRNTAGIGGGGIFLPGDTHGAVYVCSSHVRISPNDPNDPPGTAPCSVLNLLR